MALPTTHEQYQNDVLDSLAATSAFYAKHGRDDATPDEDDLDGFEDPDDEPDPDLWRKQRAEEYGIEL